MFSPLRHSISSADVDVEQFKNFPSVKALSAAIISEGEKSFENAGPLIDAYWWNKPAGDKKMSTFRTTITIMIIIDIDDSFQTFGLIRKGQKIDADTTCALTN